MNTRLTKSRNTKTGSALSCLIICCASAKTCTSLSGLRATRQTRMGESYCIACSRCPPGTLSSTPVLLSRASTKRSTISCRIPRPSFTTPSFTLQGGGTPAEGGGSAAAEAPRWVGVRVTRHGSYQLVLKLGRGSLYGGMHTYGALAARGCTTSCTSHAQAPRTRRVRTWKLRGARAAPRAILCWTRRRRCPGRWPRL